MAIQANSGRSAELSFNGCTCVGKDEQIRPLWDQIVVEPLEVNHSTLIVVIEHSKPLRGIVKAVGPGSTAPWPTPTARGRCGFAVAG